MLIDVVLDMSNTRSGPRRILKRINSPGKLMPPFINRLRGTNAPGESVSCKCNPRSSRVSGGFVLLSGRRWCRSEVTPRPYNF